MKQTYTKPLVNHRGEKIMSHLSMYISHYNCKVRPVLDALLIGPCRPRKHRQTLSRKQFRRRQVVHTKYKLAFNKK